MIAADAASYETAIDAALAAGDLVQAERLSLRYLADAGPANGDVSPRALWLRAAYLAGQVSLASGRLRQALDRLQPVVQKADQLPADLVVRVRLFAAEALARLQRDEEARGQLVAVSSADLGSDPLLLLRSLRIRLWLGEVEELRDDIARCARALAAREEWANLALLMCEQGRAWERVGDLTAAEQCWDAALAHAGRGRDRLILADVLVQQGRLEHLRGRLPLALARYDEALRQAAAPAQTQEIALRRVLVLMDANQQQRAHDLAQDILGERNRVDFADELRPLANLVSALLGGSGVATDDEQRAFLANRQGDASLARQLYLQSLEGNPSAEQHARRTLALGMLALAQGDRGEATSWLKQAEALARVQQMPEVHTRALEGLARIAAELQRDDNSAYALFEKAAILAEVQAGQFTHASDAAAYRSRSSNVVTNLLRSACRRDDTAAVFRFQELARGRLLLDLWRSASPTAMTQSLLDVPALQSVEEAIVRAEQELRGSGTPPAELLTRSAELKARRDRLLFEALRNRSRRGGAALPGLPELHELQNCLEHGTVYISPVLLDDELFLLVVRYDRAQLLHTSHGATQLGKDIEALGGCIESQIARYRAGLPMGSAERIDLDTRLAALGHGSLGTLLRQALRDSSRLIWAADERLHGLPIAALRLGNRYLIEEVEVVRTFSGALVVLQAHTRRETRGWWRPALIVAEDPAVLPGAAREAEGVAAAFLRRRMLSGKDATRTALRQALGEARIAHFACHARFEEGEPLLAHLVLPSGEKLHALECLDQPLHGMPLVTLSACRSAEVGSLLGREAFGLVTGLLSAGVRAVLAGLWPVADREAASFMWSFYRERMAADLATALAKTQRASLQQPGSTPLFWAAFALFGDAAALQPGWLVRVVAPWRQAWHARRWT